MTVYSVVLQSGKELMQMQTRVGLEDISDRSCGFLLKWKMLSKTEMGLEPRNAL